MDKEEFKIINSEKLIKEVYGSIPEWRHNFVYNKVGSLYSCGGIIYILF